MHTLPIVYADNPDVRRMYDSALIEISPVPEASTKLYALWCSGGAVASAAHQHLHMHIKQKKEKGIHLISVLANSFETASAYL